MATKKIDGVKISWTLGALMDDVYDLQETEQMSFRAVGKDSQSANTNHFTYIIIGFISCAILILVLISVFVILRNRNKDTMRDSNYVSII